ncbi:UNVERIFIED_CONTAM: hypothetical protein Sradi_3077800 [Sesamum radiatum]|uniref:Cyclin-dependent kinase inhibitor n=1 Tax=Sesamum radiatum TaxID=300843 RepID=A0AAW2RD69_SESRA
MRRLSSFSQHRLAIRWISESENSRALTFSLPHFHAMNAGTACPFQRRVVKTSYLFRGENTPSSEVQAGSDELESTATPRESNSRRCSTAEKMPTTAELEEFFVAAEMNLQKQFIDK